MSLRNLSVDFAFYGLLDLLQRSVGLIMVPLYTHVLSQAQYGELDIILIVTTVLFVLVDLQLIAGFSRFYLEQFKAGGGPRFVGTILVVRFVVGVVIPGAFLLAGYAGWLEFDFLPSFRAHALVWTLSLFTVPVTLAYDVLVLQTRMLRLKGPFAAAELSNTVISCVASVLFVAVWKLGIVGIVIGLGLGRVVGLVPLFWSLRREIQLCVDRAVLKNLMQYSLPLVPGRWVGHASAYIGRFFIYGVRGADQNAILAVCTKVAGVIGLYSVSFRAAWEPMAMSYIGEAEGESFYVRSLRLFSAGGLGAILFLAAALHPLMGIIAPESYNSVTGYFPVFAVAVLLTECDSNLQLGNQIARTTHWVSISSLVYLVVNITVLVLLTNRLGIFAAGLGLAVAAVAKGTVTYFSAQHHHRIRYDGRAAAWMAAGCIGLLALGTVLHVHLIGEWTFSLGAALLGATVPWLMLAPIERHRVVGVIRSRLSAGVRAQ